jgi:hypothetical protein
MIAGAGLRQLEPMLDAGLDDEEQSVRPLGVARKRKR